ncbi:MAG: Rrf2 family transcriptional regulator [Pirellulales bacterium]|nr:Rrf2 family transcriptional regulator [Pirellulales bacterium]
MKLSRTVTYALQAALQLAKTESNEPIPCSQIAEQGQMPERFLLQILRNLVNHGVLQSTRGVEGGYRLRRRPEEISLLDVIEAVDGPLATDMPEDAAFPIESVTKLQLALQEVTASTRNQLASIKLSQLVQPRNS